MKTNYLLMRTIHYILLLTNVFIYANISKSQSLPNDSIFWDNGNLSLLSDQGRVWIVQKKGGTIKEAHIVEIKKDKSTLVYEKDRCLHDISIGNISKIIPGKNAISAMYFQEDNTPIIKKYYEKVGRYLDPTDFKHTAFLKAEQKTTNSSANKHPVIQATIIQNSNAISSDTLIDEAGIATPIKIISMESKIITYKKSTNINGPIYVKPFDDAVITKYTNSTTINLYNKP